MPKKKVILIKSNLIDRDSRVLKERDTLKRYGYSITYLCWDRDLETSVTEQGESEEQYREITLRLRAPWGIKVLPFLPVWWCFVFVRLMKEKCDVMHVINFDSVVPAVIAGKLKRKPVIYEIEDAYADEIVLPKVIRYLAIFVDKLFMPLAKAIVLIDEAQVKEFGGIPNSKVIPVYDTPANTDKVVVAQSRNETFSIFYAGFFFKARQMNLDEIFEAIASISEVKLFIAGSGDQVEEIKARSRQMPDKLEFLGFISAEEVLRWSCTADLLLVARTPVIAANRYNCGSTFLRAMMCGKPFLANKGTATADKVIEEDCGLTVDSDDVGGIRQAILTLKNNPELCRKFGDNARKAYEECYRWEVMEQRLMALYRELLFGSDKASDRKQKI